MAKGNTDKLESERLVLQSRLDSEKSALERNRLGQFATPTALAREIVAYGIRLLGEGAGIKMLDPAVGTGSFVSAALATAPTGRLRAAVGYEIDPHYGEPARALWTGQKLDLRLEDFTKADPAPGDLANLVICNPPYVRHHHMGKVAKEDLQARAEAACGVRINGLSGLYCYFLGLSHRWMESDAVAGWLIPSEFMDVNYGRQLKEYLLNKVELIHIHRFDPSDVQFSDALVSSAIVWFRNRKPAVRQAVTFSFGGTLSDPTLSREVSMEELRHERKWTRYPASTGASPKATVTLGDLFTVSRGLATGDNGFFIMTREQIAARGLPMACFTPVLPGARHIDGDEIEADAEGLPLVRKPLFLLDTKLSEDVLAERHPALWDYLQTGRDGDDPVAERYLCRNRKRWYAQENRPAAPIICTYMGRSRDGAKPFRFILNHSRATASNVYLMLYPKPVLAGALGRDPSLLRRVWTFLNGISAEELLGNGRVYGGGLHKLEPKELRNVSILGLAMEVPELAMMVGAQGERAALAAE